MRSYPLVIVLVAFAFLAFGLARNAWGIWHAPQTVVACGGGTALVMGAAQYDGRPSPAFARRLDRAERLYRDGCVDRIVVSGGQRDGDRFTEGETGLRYLLDRTVPGEALLAETTASTSLENLRHSLELVQDDRLVIVTDDLHAHRTAWLAGRLGLSADMATVEVPVGRLSYGVRELFVMVVYQLGLVR